MKTLTTKFSIKNISPSFNYTKQNNTSRLTLSCFSRKKFLREILVKITFLRSYLSVLLNKISKIVQLIIYPMAIKESRGYKKYWRISWISRGGLSGKKCLRSLMWIMLKISRWETVTFKKMNKMFIIPWMLNLLNPSKNLFLCRAQRKQRKKSLKTNWIFWFPKC